MDSPAQKANEKAYQDKLKAEREWRQWQIEQEQLKKKHLCANNDYDRFAIYGEI